MTAIDEGLLQLTTAVWGSPMGAIRNMNWTRFTPAFTVWGSF